MNLKSKSWTKTGVSTLISILMAMLFVYLGWQTAFLIIVFGLMFISLVLGLVAIVLIPNNALEFDEYSQKDHYELTQAIVLIGSISLAYLALFGATVAITYCLMGFALWIITEKIFDSKYKKV